MSIRIAGKEDGGRILPNPFPLSRALLVFVVSLISLPSVAFSFAEEDHEQDHGASAAITPDPAERLHTVEVDYEIRRDGTVAFEQRFRLGVAGVAIRRGPVLNYLTVFEGPAGLILDQELEILEVLRDGEPETYRADRQAGFTTLYIGASERELEHRDHDYIIRGRMKADWRRGEGVFIAAYDLVGALPVLPIDEASATVRLPEGVQVLRYTPALTGVDPAAEEHGPAWESEVVGNVLRVRSTASMGQNRSFFINLAWPSATFATKSQWLMVMRQHPRLPLAGFSAIALLWALAILVLRWVRRRGV